MESNFVTSTDKQTLLKEIKYNEFMEFSKKLTDEVYVQCLVQGNIRENEALAEIQNSLELLNLSPLAVSAPSQYLKDSTLPLGEKCYRVQNLNPSDINSFVLNFYQTDIDKSSKLSFSDLKKFLEVILTFFLRYTILFA